MPWLLILVSLVAGCGRFGFGADGGRSDARDPDGAADDGTGSDAAMVDAAGDDTLISASGHVQASPPVDTVGPFTMTLAAPSTTGSLLVVAFGTSTTANLVMPAGWAIAQQASVSGGCVTAIAYYANHPGGITSVTFEQSSVVPTVAHLTEWTGATALDAVGTAISNSPVSTLTVQTATPTTTSGGVAINVFCEAVNMPQYTAGDGWTNLTSASKGPSEASFSTNYLLHYAASATVSGAVTTTVAGKYAAVVATFRP